MSTFPPPLPPLPEEYLNLDDGQNFDWLFNDVNEIESEVVSAAPEWLRGIDFSINRGVETPSKKELENLIKKLRIKLNTCKKKLTNKPNERFLITLEAIDDDTKKALEAANLNPLLELTIGRKKSLNGLMTHLNQKWEAARTHLPMNLNPATAELQLYPFQASIFKDTAWNSHHAAGITVTDIFEFLKHEPKNKLKRPEEFKEFKVSFFFYTFILNF